MIRKSPNRRCLVAALTLICALAGASANAAPATGSGTVTGGFTHWEGDLGYTRPGAFEVEYVRLNGIDVPNNLPDVPLPNGDGVRRGTIDLPADTDSVAWQYKIPSEAAPYTANLVAFQGASFSDVVIGQAFKLGTISVTNGIWFDSADIALAVTTVSADPAFNAKSFSDTLRYVVTSNSASRTPEQNADFVSFLGRPELGEIRVYEAFDSPTGLNTGSIELWGKIGSLTPLFFANAQGGVFAQPAALPVPEPSTWALMLAGLGVMSMLAHRRRNSAR